ncbi:uncharacterized protein [Halyomorpha halys]|uniref:uncharacterized protein isoform X2 n=1 Tax=Halyomorpha halys TaxID=286706 RepID=UPI0006D51330|nr:uncharacterized protein LOC106686660 isoform X2 [Halyomorpha halys]
MKILHTLLNWITFGWLNRRKKRAKVPFEEEIDIVEEEPCKVFDVYVDIPKEIILHYKHCDVHGYTIPVDLKTALYKSNIFFHPNISADDAPACILHNAEVPGSEKNRIDNGRKSISGRKSIDEIPAIVVHKFKLAEETRADGTDEVKHHQNNQATTLNSSYNCPDKMKRSSALCFNISRRHSEHDRPASLLLQPRRFTPEPRQRRLTSKSVVIITPDEENPK